MMAGEPISSLAASLYSALLQDLSPVEYEESAWDAVAKQRKPTGVKKSRRPYENEVEVKMFLQTWGSTALGFGGIGGSAMTSAYTVAVFGPNGDVVVYFGGRKAYHIKRPNDNFMSDCAVGNLSDVAGRSRYSRAPELADGSE